MKKYYLPRDEKGKLLWLKNFAGKINLYATILNVTPAEVTSIQNDLNYFDFVLDMVNKYKQNVNQRVTYKNLLLNGDGSTPPIGGIPANPTFGTAPTAVSAGVIKRAIALAQRIKKQSSYTIAIGEELGIIGDEETIDVNTMKPILTIEKIAQKPNLKWKKQSMQGIRIYVDRTGNGYEFLATDTQPDYLDKAPLPTAGTSAIWKYKAVYILQDEEVGEYSDEVSITVTSLV
jgi:hypothetical protein